MSSGKLTLLLAACYCAATPLSPAIASDSETLAAYTYRNPGCTNKI
ncbi:hypothetical protein NRB_09570 [Novosphingobium sp. 11B]